MWAAHLGWHNTWAHPVALLRLPNHAGPEPQLFSSGFFLLWSGLCQAKSVYVCVSWELLGTHVVPFDQTADLV